MSATEKTCFVIIGYGKKMDYSTGREIDLDKTFEYIIKPAFEEHGFLCFRASDISHSGVIDVPMYEHILKADFVVADLSTLNANVLYELGVRHAVRKNTTIIISEKELTYPFDLTHILIEKYEHLGKAIDYGEVLRFKKILSDKIKELKDQPKTDSPLYTFFPDLEMPGFTKKEIEKIKENISDEGSLSDYLTKAEHEKNQKNYLEAIKLLRKALTLKQDNTLVVQRLALVTYKSGLPDKVTALRNAKAILQPLNPQISTDLETLGLSGAIEKRLYEELGEREHLTKAIWFYEKGFYIGNDYYNGINLAYLFNVSAVSETEPFQAYASYGNATRIRAKVLEICNELLHSKGWVARTDKEWIYLTLAEIYFSFNELNKENEMINKAKEVMEGDFALDSYNAQRAKLATHIAAFQEKYGNI